MLCFQNLAEAAIPIALNVHHCRAATYRCHLTKANVGAAGGLAPIAASESRIVIAARLILPVVFNVALGLHFLRA